MESNQTLNFQLPARLFLTPPIPCSPPYPDLSSLPLPRGGGQAGGSPNMGILGVVGGREAQRPGLTPGSLLAAAVVWPLSCTLGIPVPGEQGPGDMSCHRRGPWQLHSDRATPTHRCACAHTHMHTHTRLHTHVHKYPHTHAHACPCTHTRTHTCPHIHTSAHTDLVPSYCGQTVQPQARCCSSLSLSLLVVKWVCADSPPVF